VPEIRKTCLSARVRSQIPNSDGVVAVEPSNEGVNAAAWRVDSRLVVEQVWGEPRRPSTRRVEARGAGRLPGRFGRRHGALRRPAVAGSPAPLVDRPACLHRGHRHRAHPPSRARVDAARRTRLLLRPASRSGRASRAPRTRAAADLDRPVRRRRHGSGRLVAATRSTTAISSSRRCSPPGSGSAARRASGP